MAIIHRAELKPGKIELITTWLDAQPWGRSGPVIAVGAYRFDDPDGEVGIEGHVVRRDGIVLHVPLTYRGAPLDDPDARLVGRMQHSVLGERFAYDASTDPVAIDCFARALRGEQDAAIWVIHDGGDVVGHRDPSVILTVTSKTEHGADAAVGCVMVPLVDGSQLRIARSLGADDPGGGVRLLATWSGGSGTVAGLTPPDPEQTARTVLT